MGITAIEWTDRSANPIRARHKVTGKVGWHCVMTSPGCANCYSQTLDGRFGTKLPFTQRSQEEIELFLDLKPMEALRRVRKPSRVFLCDMTDLFQDAVPFSWVDQIFSEIWAMKQHTFQVLTKRADRMAKYFESRAREMPWPLCNVWLGVSVENQKYADERIPHLLQVPAAVRFVSYEPALGPVDWGSINENNGTSDDSYNAIWGWRRSYSYKAKTLQECSTGVHSWIYPGLDWVIVGGESGPKARPFDLAWARSTIEQCKSSPCAVFVKQLGSTPFDSDAALTVPGAQIKMSYEQAIEPENLDLLSQTLDAMKVYFRDKKGGSTDEWPEDLRIREFPIGSTQPHQHSNA